VTGNEPKRYRYHNRDAHANEQRHYSLHASVSRTI
jgi:hypothetical protein